MLSASELKQDLKILGKTNYKIVNHIVLLGFMEELGYPVKGILGLCNGFYMTTIRAFFQNRMQECNEVLTYLEKEFDYSDKSIGKMKDLLTGNETSSAEYDKRLIDVLAFFDEILLYQINATNGRFFSPCLTSRYGMMSGDEIEKQTGFVNADLSNLKTIEDFISYLSYVFDAVIKSGISLSIKINMGYFYQNRFLMHVMGVCYNHVTQQWVLIDINQVPVKELSNARFADIESFIHESLATVQKDNVQFTLFKSQLYTQNQEPQILQNIVDEINNQMKLSEPMESTIGLGYFEIKALDNLKADGVKAFHLRAWHGSEYFSPAHEHALTYLLRKCGYSPEKAIAEINDLNSSQVEFISSGNTRNDVIGLQSIQIMAVNALKHFGLTAEHFRTLSPREQCFHLGHYNTLMFLLKNKGMQPEDAIKALNSLNDEQITYISIYKKFPENIKPLISPAGMNMSIFSSSTQRDTATEATRKAFSVEESAPLAGLGHFEPTCSASL